jgi:hypothetical protein
MHQEDEKPLTGHDYSPTSPQSSHHQSMSTDSTSPSSVSAEDHYQFVNEADEIVLPAVTPTAAGPAVVVVGGRCYPTETMSAAPRSATMKSNVFERETASADADAQTRGFTLWNDLDRDGAADTFVIPSFILESPPMGPLRSIEDVDCLGAEHQVGYSDVSIHSLRKGTPPPPFFFFFISGLNLGFDDFRK